MPRRQTPIEMYSVEWYKLNLNTIDKYTTLRYDQALAELLVFYPRKERPEEFNKVDVLDWRQHLLDLGEAPGTANFKVGAVHTFWRWLTEARGLLLVNIARIPRLATPPPKVPELSGELILKFYESIRSPRLRAVALEIINGTDAKKAACAAGYGRRNFYLYWHQAAVSAGMPWLTPSRLCRLAQQPLARLGLQALLQQASPLPHTTQAQ